jgi:hypothetical protein
MSKTYLRTRAIQEPVFPVANTDFEGGDNDNGYGDYIFLVKHVLTSLILSLYFFSSVSTR